MQTCIWSSWCHCHSLSLASVKSRLVLPFWYRLTRVVPEKSPLNGCVCVSRYNKAIGRVRPSFVSTLNQLTSDFDAFLMIHSCMAIGNESVPIQLAQCWFPGLATSNAKIWRYFLKIYGSDFIKQQSETVMVWNYQDADCSLKNKFIVSFTRPIIFGTLSYPIVRRGLNLKVKVTGQGQWGQIFSAVLFIHISYYLRYLRRKQAATVVLQLSCLLTVV